MNNNLYKVKRKDWELYSYNYNDGNNMAIIRFDVAHAKEQIHIGFDNCVRIILELNTTQYTNYGFPTNDTKVSIKQLESDLLASLNEESRYVASMKYFGIVELIFQTNIPKEIERITNIIFQKTAFNIVVKHEHGWDFFDERISPQPTDWQSIKNRQTLDILLKNGAELNRVYYFEHSFIGEKEDLEYLFKELKPYGYTKESIVNDMIILKNSLDLNLNLINNTTESLMNFSSKINVQYKGWGVKLK